MGHKMSKRSWYRRMGGIWRFQRAEPGDSVLNRMCIVGSHLAEVKKDKDGNRTTDLDNMICVRDFGDSSIALE